MAVLQHASDIFAFLVTHCGRRKIPSASKTIQFPVSISSSSPPRNAEHKKFCLYMWLINFSLFYVLSFSMWFSRSASYAKQKSKANQFLLSLRACCGFLPLWNAGLWGECDDVWLLASIAALTLRGMWIKFLHKWWSWFNLNSIVKLHITLNRSLLLIQLHCLLSRLSNTHRHSPISPLILQTL